MCILVSISTKFPVSCNWIPICHILFVDVSVKEIIIAGGVSVLGGIGGGILGEEIY